MPISFAGVPIQPPPGSLGAIDQWWHHSVIDEWDYIGYRVSGVQHLPVPYPPRREPLRIGVLSWPVGADRFAICHLIATGQQVDAVRTALGTSPAARPLTLDDGTTTITADMFAIVRPISQRGDSRELYLLTLVDDRHFWWESGGAVLPSAPVTWSDLFTKLFTLVGVTPTSIDTVPAAYLTPNEHRWFSDKPLPVPILLESAARQVGARIVRRLDGTVRVVTTANAVVEDLARWTQFASLALAGGQITATDIARFSPASVDVVFFDGTKTNITLTSLALSEYDGVSGIASKKGLWTADPEAPTTAQKSAYATQAATDYYTSLESLTDADLRSFQDVDPVGMDGCVEWVHDPARFVTRIVRPTWFDRNIYGRSVPSAPATGSAPEYTDECLNGFLVRYKATVSLDSSGLSQTEYAFEKSLGIRCAPVSGSGSATSGAPGPDPTMTFPTVTDSVTSVCPDLTCREPAGAVLILPTTYAGTCFHRADGSALSRTTYADLFAAYGTVFGSGDGSHTFNLPTLADPTSGLSYFVRLFAQQITVQTARVTVQAFGSVTDPFCETDPTGCCPESGSGGSVRSDCCGTATPLNVVTFAAIGPMKTTTNCTLTGDLTRSDPNVLVWDLVDPVVGCDGAVGLDLTLYCSGSEWRISGRLLPYGFTEHIYFDVEADLDLETLLLTSSVSVPAPGDLVFGIESPCVGEVTFNCTTGGCVEVAGPSGTYATLAACRAVCTGGGGTVPACGCDVPSTLYAHFGGALASWGSVRLGNVGTSWTGPDNGTCGVNGLVTLFCNPTNNKWQLDNAGPSTNFNTGEVALVSCSPFVFTGSGVATGTCSGAFTVTVNSTP